MCEREGAPGSRPVGLTIILVLQTVFFLFRGCTGCLFSRYFALQQSQQKYGYIVRSLQFPFVPVATILGPLLPRKRADELEVELSVDIVAEK